MDPHMYDGVDWVVFWIFGFFMSLAFGLGLLVGWLIWG